MTLIKPNLYVIARFLETIHENGHAINKSKIQRHLGLRYPRFLEYLQWLQDHHLIETQKESDQSERIILTPKGLESYYRLSHWIDETIDISQN